MPASGNLLQFDATALTASGIGGAGPDAAALAALGRPGYEALRAELDKVPQPDPKLVL